MSGNYRATQQADGTWIVHDVPVFVAHTLKATNGQPVKIGHSWLAAALKRAHDRGTGYGGKDGGAYFAPVHLEHTHDTKGRPQKTERIGQLRLTALRPRYYEGRRSWALVGDIERVSPEMYQRIKRGELPYLSAEVLDVRQPEINSLALMDDTVPFFRLPMLTVGEEVRHPNPAAYRARPQSLGRMNRPAIAARANQTRYSLLLSFGGPTVATPMPAPAGAPPVAPPQDPRSALMAAFTAALDQVFGPAQPAAPPAAPVDPGPSEPPEQGPAPAELPVDADETDDEDNGEDYCDDDDEDDRPGIAAQADGSMEARYSARLAKVEHKISKRYEARLAQLEGKLDAQKAKEERTALIANAHAELRALGLDTSERRAKVETYAAKGADALQVYLDALHDEGAVDPPTHFDGELPARAIAGDADATRYSARGPKAMAKAAEVGREYDEFVREGVPMTQTRAEYVEMFVGAPTNGTAANGRAR